MDFCRKSARAMMGDDFALGKRGEVFEQCM